MIRKTALVAVPLAVALLSTGVASGQTVTPPVSPTKVTAKTTPKRDRTRPYRFRTTGRIVLPAASKLPIICPPGAKNLSYCFHPTTALLCTGKVTVTIKKRTRTISSRTVRVRSTCTYRSTATLRSRLASRRGRLTVKVRFKGNTYLKARSASSQSVRAG